MSDVFQILINYHSAFSRGLLVTIGLVLIAWIFGIAIGSILGTVGHSIKHIGKSIQYGYFFIQSIPVIIALFWVHYPLQELLEISIHPFITASFILTVFSTVSVAQIIKNALDSFPSQYEIAGVVCGLSNQEIIRKIKVPIIFRSVLPEILSIQISVLQMTLFASLISVEELFRVAQQINSQIYKPVEIYTGVAAFFISICLPLTIMANNLKIKYSRDYSEK